MMKIKSRFWPAKAFRPAKELMATVAVPFFVLMAGIFNPMLVHAANINLLTNDGLGSSSLNGATNWSNLAAPGSGNDYFTSASGLRTPGDANNYTFNGHSLTLQPGTSSGYSFIYKGTAANNVYTIKNLTNNGGLIRSGAGSGNICTIGGNMVAAGNSTIDADQSAFVISGNLIGGAVLTNLNPGPQTYGSVTYSGTNATFTGELLVGANGILVFGNTHSAPGNPASLNAGQVTLGASSTLEDLAGVTFNNANGGIALAGNVTINISGSNTVTTVAEPVSGGSVSVTKTGAGTLYLDAACSYTGTTTVSAGTIAGSGSLSGPLVVSSTAGLGAGVPGAAVGTFSVNNNLTLQGNTTLRINNTGGLATNDQVVVTGNAAYGGILTITNITSDGTVLTVGETFQLFNVSGSSSGNFSTSIAGSPGAGLSYVFNPTNGVLSVVSTASLAAILAHRYSFFSEPNGSVTATDLIAGANGTLQGSAAITGGQLVLNGTSGTYANLPGGLITGDAAVSVEAWADYHSLPANCYLFSFGNTDGSGSGENYIFCAPQAARITISGVDPGYNAEQNAACGGWSGETNLQVVAVYNPSAFTMSIYTNGVLAGVNNGMTTSLSSVSNIVSYIGRSLYTSDPYAPINVDEFRVWNGALSAQQIAVDAASGPGQVITNTGSLQAIHLNLAAQMPVGRVYSFAPGGTAAAVANLQSQGGTQQALVTGDFASISNVNLVTYGPPTFASANSSIATVNASGLVTAIATGTTAISTTYGGLSATQTVSVVFATNTFLFDSFGDGYWNIINQGNNNALVTGAGSSSEEILTNGAAEQQFQMLYNYQNNSFRIRQQSSWRFIGSLSGGISAGTALATLSGYSGTASQRWNLIDAGGGYFRIANAATNLVLQTDNGTPPGITLAQSNSSPFQLWKFAYQTHFLKKGTAGYEGSAAQYGTSWAYNYDDHTGSSLPSQFDFVPMIDTEYWEPVSDLQSRDAGWLVSSQQGYLLGYNEPDNSGSASTNPSTNTAIATWPSLEGLNIPLVGPAMQNMEDSWENSFYRMVATNNFRVDYAAVHLYVPPNASSVISDLRSEYNAYGRPVWLTEFSPVDWNGNQGWTEDDDYNFLAEFMWQAEDQDWLKRYSIFPFTGTNALPPYQSTTVGYRGNFFLTGSTLSPYGELYSTWDGDRTLRARIPYIIHNLGTSFRLTASNNVSKPQAATIYVRNAAAEWALSAVGDGAFYIISLNDGRRLSDTSGVIGLAPIGTIGPAVEWTFSGPNSSGYYYIGNSTAGNNLNGSGTAPAIAFGLTSSATQNSSTEWRVIKPYQAVSINTNDAAPTIILATPGSGSVALSWTGGGGAPYFNVYRSNVSGSGYSRVAGATTQSSFTDNTVTNGVPYYYVVTAMNILGGESAYSGEAMAIPSSLISTNIAFAMADGQTLQLTWPGDHTGWTLQAQTNDLGTGMGTNWQDVAGSVATNQVFVPISPANGAVFYRLIHQ